MIQDLIDRIAQNVGLDPSVAQSAVGLIMNFLDKEGPQDQIGGLLDQFPGVRDLMSQTAATEGEGGGGLMGMLGGLMGGSAGGLMGLVGKLNEAGVDMGSVQGVTQELIGYAKEKAGPEMVEQVLGQIPGLGQYLRG
ncbi:MAG: DUF2267 domain-containing protein [Hyphomicrobiaceae bacterium]|nr:DUF2267 domain-containing protein [Hyphomicrobiaceae bacterium]